jgi:hypothetical protein
MKIYNPTTSIYTVNAKYVLFIEMKYHFMTLTYWVQNYLFVYIITLGARDRVVG